MFSWMSLEGQFPPSWPACRLQSCPEGCRQRDRHNRHDIPAVASISKIAYPLRFAWPLELTALLAQESLSSSTKLLVAMGVDWIARLPRPPSREERDRQQSGNPFKLMASLTLMQHLLFSAAMFAWIMCVRPWWLQAALASLTWRTGTRTTSSVSRMSTLSPILSQLLSHHRLSVNRLNRQFGVETSTLTLAITLTLLFRSLGAVIFGLISDRYGRKWPLVVNLVIIAALELGSSFVNTYSQFLGVRSLFGIGMVTCLPLFGERKALIFL